MEKEPERMDSDAIRRTVQSLGDGGCGGVQMEKEPERMDSDAIRRTVQSLVDTRPVRCRDHAYEFTRLDSPADMHTSIVLSYHGAEFYSVKLALTAIVEFTPYDLYAEIVLIDDGTTDDRVVHAATTFLRNPKFNKVRTHTPPAQFTPVHLEGRSIHTTRVHGPSSVDRAHV